MNKHHIHKKGLGKVGLSSPLIRIRNEDVPKLHYWLFTHTIRGFRYSMIVSHTK